MFERKNQFGLRKLNIGIVSVIFGTFVWITATGDVHASEKQLEQTHPTTKVSSIDSQENKGTSVPVAQQGQDEVTESNQETSTAHQGVTAENTETARAYEATTVESPSETTETSAEAAVADEPERKEETVPTSTAFRASNVSNGTEPNVREQLIDGVDQRLYQKRVAVMPNSAQAQTLGMQRGTYQARDNLGIIVPANTKLYIHQAGPEKQVDLRVSLMTNDGAYNKSQVVPKTGEWVTIETGIESAAFMYMPSGIAYQPVVAYYVENKQDSALPTYRKGQDQATFEQQWIDQDAAYAYVDGDNHAMLIPRVDRDRILAMKTQTSADAFKSLDEMIDYYEDVISKYNTWAGFVDDASSVNFNVGSKYLIVANKNGFGSAYWSTDHTGTNSPSIEPYLQRGWLALHEIGHGYDGWMIQDGRMDLAEVINNVFANQYEQTIQHKENGWLYGGNQRAFQEGIHHRMLENSEGVRFNDSGFKGKLDFMTRLVRLTGIEGMTHMYQTMRTHAAEGRLPVDVPRWISHDWLAAQGVNGLPYFDLYHIDMSRQLKDDLNAYHHSYIYPLAMLIDNPAERQKYVARLGLATEYELVKSSDLKDTSIYTTADVQLNLQGQKLRDNAKVVLMDGENKVAEATVNNGVAHFEHLRAGVYKVVAPATLNHMLPEHAYLVVRENGENQVVLDYPSSTQTQQFVSQQILLKGLGNDIFAQISYQPHTGEVKYQEYAKKPHVYFTDEYAHVTIRTKDGQVVVDRTMIGDRVGEALTKIRKLQVGDTITIMHREPSQRRVVQRIETGERVVMPDADKQTVAYTLTDKGFIVNDETQQDADMRYMQTLTTDVETWIAKKALAPEKDDRVPLYRLVRAIQSLSQTESEKLLTRLAPYLDPSEQLTIPSIAPIEYGAERLTGQAQPHSSVTVTVPSGKSYDVTADDSGSWVVELPGSERLTIQGDVTVQAHKEGYEPSEIVRQTIEAPLPSTTTEEPTEPVGDTDNGEDVEAEAPKPEEEEETPQDTEESETPNATDVQEDEEPNATDVQEDEPPNATDVQEDEPTEQPAEPVEDTDNGEDEEVEAPKPEGEEETPQDTEESETPNGTEEQESEAPNATDEQEDEPTEQPTEPVEDIGNGEDEEVSDPMVPAEDNNAEQVGHKDENVATPEVEPKPTDKMTVKPQDKADESESPLTSGIVQHVTPQQKAPKQMKMVDYVSTDAYEDSLHAKTMALTHKKSTTHLSSTTDNAVSTTVRTATTEGVLPHTGIHQSTTKHQPTMNGWSFLVLGSLMILGGWQLINRRQKNLNQ
ncbi:putative mucin/carbohydrate-binding domain-containing protein [Staphylococcus microti]|uniref:putative mucin/carbohydrate-binding domain-containing protein n=1 Tax=Staphylococcus microti TaxID=569857 RepID=UPI000CD12674|nr:putative mucin/carbohydrate-binding domain-containing protein [Staphylococcus microti]